MNPSLKMNSRLGDWISVLRDPDLFVIRTGKVELGQHIHHALRVIAARELDVPIEMIAVEPVSTSDSPAEGLTAGSLSVQHGGSAIAAASRTMRQMAQRVAETRLNPGNDHIEQNESQFEAIHSGLKVSLFECAAAVSPDTNVEGLSSEHVWENSLGNSLLTNASYRDAASGESRYIQDLVFENTIHARAVRGPGRIVRAEIDSIESIAGVVAVVSQNGFLAIGCREEYELERCCKEAETHISRQLPGDCAHDGPVEGWIKSACSNVSRFEHSSRRAQSASEVSAQIAVSRPFLLHASIAPSCAFARYRDGQLEVWSHSQNIFALRDVLASQLELLPENVRVHHVGSAGCYGHNGADDAAADAALIAYQLPGEMVRVSWPRIDDITRAPVGAPMFVEIDAALDSEKRISHWDYRIWSGAHGQRPGGHGNPNLLAFYEKDPSLRPAQIKDVPPAAGGGAERNGFTCYDVSEHSVEVSLLQHIPVRTSALRGLGTQMNVAAIEGIMDELAVCADEDPISFRLRHLGEPRARAMLERLRDNWMGEAAAGIAENEAVGIAYSRYKEKSAYAAVAVRLALEDQPVVKGIWAVVDAGPVVDFAGLRNQVEGGAIQAISWTLLEGAYLRNSLLDIESLEDYPILGWDCLPKFTLDVVEASPGSQPLGVGECMQGPVTAAILNALSKVAGMRLGHLPVNRERLIAAMSA
ncbi:aerobic-type carbon monoxide dehydrogenase, large subunit CoxL/CutL-like protein [Hoeflea sp. IMCC20628]|uniref:molybdopterin cofactor-binding domain-containing protein n=1 Tax=Hoeflea sp. IMCC20628 TaxID=1620421 RepID=UPI00063BE798|nr:molybdopterin cofactor-binding domain-containing protein [Hoeflea sp. IMCC20628]AKH98917.1 aerobic-type carbon monoxide dehydrogenase, large subunit CoxL/CutL-like protein [Hoeflea sp. IMCC20628]